MHRAGRIALSILTGFIVAVIIASACIVAYSQYNRALDAEAEVGSVTETLRSTELDLQTVRADLASTDASLTQTEELLARNKTELLNTRKTLATMTRSRDAYAKRANTCRYLVRINDHLLFASSSYSNATDHLIDGNRRAASRDLRRAAAHARAVQRLVVRSGYRSLTRLVNACAPPRQG